ncbi:unnamed protein product [Withania somnifera]
MANINESESRKKEVVAIIGAGISGLLACKYAISKGFDPIVFESESSTGGVWTQTIGSTKLQTPKPVYQFSDFPWPHSVTELFPHQQTVLEYIQSYATHFDLLRHIQFNSKVLSLSYEDDSITGELNLWHSNKGKWNITVQDTRTISTHTQIYQVDFVVVCVGRFSQVPNIPEFPPNKGPEAFEGKVIHSMDYSKMDSTAATNIVKGKHVAVVGFQKTGLDIAMECSTVNGVECPCTVLIRTPHWNLPDYFPWGLNMGYLYLNRFSELMVHKPGEGLLLSLLATTLSPLGMHSPRIPQLAIIGFSESVSNLHTSEIRCRWLAELLDGKFKLPSVKDMEKDIGEWDKYKKRYSNLKYYRRSCIGALHIWYNDQLCKDMGWNPKRKKSLWAEWFEPYGPMDYTS